MQLTPTFQKLIPLDCMIGVTDTTLKFLKYIPGEKIKMPIDITGTDVPKEDTLCKYLLIQANLNNV